MKTKTQISITVTAKLVSAFVLATRIVQSLYFLYSKFQASNYLLWLHSLACVGPGRKPRRPVFSQRGPFHFNSCCLLTRCLLSSFINSLLLDVHWSSICTFCLTFCIGYFGFPFYFSSFLFVSNHLFYF